MARVRKGKLGGATEILRHMNFTAIPVMLDPEIEVDGKVVVEEGCRKVVKAGAILGKGIFAGGEVATINNSGDAEGVLRYDVDITDGEREVSMIIRGEIFEEKLPEEISEAARKALDSRILFIK